MRAASATICLAVLAAFTAAPAAAQEETGACWAAFEQDFDDETDLQVAVCLDGLTAEACEELADFEVDTNFAAGTPCTEIDFLWQGSCVFTLPSEDEIQLDEELCALLWVEEDDTYDAQYFCEFDEGLAGVWSDEPVCRAVPTLPRVGLALLAVVVALGGTLFVVRARSWMAF